MKLLNTQGEWILDTNTIWLNDEDDNTIETQVISSDTEICFISYDQCGTEEAMANARLISAAPRLLKGLIDLKSQLIDGGKAKDSLIIISINKLIEEAI